MTPGWERCVWRGEVNMVGERKKRMEKREDKLVMKKEARTL